MKHAHMRVVLASGALCLAVTCAVIGDTALAAGSQTAWTLSGTGIAADSGDGGQAREAAINQPRSVFPTANGGYVWAEPWSNRVRIVGPDGVIDTLAGTGTAGFSGDGGQASAASLNFVHSAAPTPDGGYLLADELNNRIRYVAPNGVITTVAGTGSQGYSGDGGPATAAQINNPRGVVALPAGGFLIPDSNNHRVRKVSASGIITTVAGTGVQGFAGDQGQATSAQLSIPFGVAPTADGGFLIVDVGNGRIRKVSAAGVITTVAGNGTDGYSGDGGPATAASLWAPHNVVATSGGGFLIADAINQRIRQVGADGVITTLIGDGVGGYSGDGGPASAAQLSVPKAVGLTAAGDVLIADEQNNRIRFVGTVTIPTNTSPPTISGNATQGQQLTAKAGGWGGTGPSIDYQWQRCSPGCSNIGGATNSSYLVAAADVGASLRVAVTGSNSAGPVTASSAQTGVISGAAAPPTSSSPPSISGLAQPGQLLTADPGSWSGTAPISYTYQWQRCSPGCANIGGATNSSYLVAAADVGASLRVAVTGSNSAGSSDASSASTAVVTAPSGTESSITFSVAASADDGEVKATNMGSGGPYPPATTPSANTNSTSFAVRRSGPSFSGYEVRVGLLRFDTSALPDAATVTRATLRLYVTDRESNNARSLVGEWYGSSNWPIDPADYTVNAASTAHAGTPITSLSENTQNDLLLQNLASVSRTGFTGLRLHVDGAAPNGQNNIFFSSFDNTNNRPKPELIITYTVGAAGETPPSNSSPPSISGLAQPGQLLTADPGSWSGTAPISYTYQWQRCSPGCANIGGATNSSYLVAAADVGASLRVAVTGSNSAGSSDATSASTAVVTAPSGTESSITFSVAASADDGEVKTTNMGSGGPYPPATTPSANTNSTSFAVRRSGPSFSGYEVRVGLLRFDTSALPDAATVTRATLRLYVTDRESNNARSLVGEWYGSSNWPIDTADYTVNAASTAHAGTPITSLSENAQNDLLLQNLASVSRTGFTGLRLHVDGAAPNGQNNIFFSSLDNTNNRPKPELIITYTVGAAGETPPSNSSPPSISGLAQQGQTLTAEPGSWSGTAPISYTYQWQRCSPGCANIGGATNSSYLVAAADVGASLRVAVTGSNSAGSSDASSASTAVVTAPSGTESTITFSVAASADDGEVKATNMGSGGPYPPATTPSANTNSTSFAVRRSGPSFSGYEVRVGLLRFDTSALPDAATVTRATLRLYVTDRESNNARSLVGEWYGSSNWPIDPADYTVNAASTAHAGTPITSLSENAQNDLLLQNLASVSRTGFTGLRLHVDGAAPNGQNNIFFSSLDNTNNRPKPELIITYTNP